MAYSGIAVGKETDGPFDQGLTITKGKKMGTFCLILLKWIAIYKHMLACLQKFEDT